MPSATTTAPLRSTIDTFFDTKTASDIESTNASLRTPHDSFPTDLKDGQVMTQAAPELVTVATAVHGAFRAADPTAAGDLIHTDVLLEDMSLRTQVIGRIEATAYLGRILDAVRTAVLTRITSVYHSRRLERDRKAGLAGAAFAP
jgi:hypothetical protein